jgi:hypothetical protein
MVVTSLEPLFAQQLFRALVEALVSFNGTQINIGSTHIKLVTEIFDSRNGRGCPTLSRRKSNYGHLDSIGCLDSKFTV